MTADEFRALALSFPHTSEAAHMGHPDFRVDGRIFATIWPDEAWAMVKLAPQDQALLIQACPHLFSRVKGAWGKNGATSVHLAKAHRTIVRKALNMALRNRIRKQTPETKKRSARRSAKDKRQRKK